MKIIKHRHTYVSTEEVINMESVHIQYEERDVDLEEVKRIAQKSAKRIQKDREDRLKKAIKNHETYYISRELDNVSTYELIKMILNKLF